MKLSFARLTAAFVLILSASAYAAPGLIHYQGRLTDKNGNPITSAVVVKFTFWNAESGGSQIGTYSDSDLVTPDANGVYSALIGDEGGTPVPASIFDNASVWLEVQFGGETLSPRKRIVTVPYAFRSANADTLGGYVSSAFVNKTGDTMSGALTITGKSTSALLQATNTETATLSTYGGYFISSSGSGSAVLGRATATGSANNYGGNFVAYGNSGIGARGYAAATGDVTNYGGLFHSEGGQGHGVHGYASATGDVSNYGGYFIAGGDSGNGVYGLCTGDSGYGVYGRAYGSGIGVYGMGNYGGYFTASGGSGRGVCASASATGDFVNYGGYFTASGDSGRGIFGNATASGSTDINYGGLFIAAGGKSRGVYGSGKAYDFYAAGTGTNYGPFTGAHEVQLAAGFPEKPMAGLIVSTAGPSKIRRDESGKISISSTLPTVKLADMANDKAVFGVLVDEAPLPEDHWFKPAAGDRFGIANALGEGRVWVCTANGDISMGDYITTSSVAGYGQKQSDDLQHAYTVGKVIEQVDWSTVTTTVTLGGKTYKAYLIAVVYTCG